MIVGSEIAMWRATIRESAATRGVFLGDAVERYTIAALSRFRGYSRPFCTDLLSAMQKKRKDAHELREVGDGCLVIAGLFPRFGRVVSPEYFTAIGAGAYGALAEVSRDNTYEEMKRKFPLIVYVLRGMRNMDVAAGAFFQ